MPEHALLPGRRIIDAISALGRTMGYVVRCEWPIDSSQNTGAAVDIAWFAEENQKFPLMIFEVETSASTGMVNNAVKVFSKPSAELEKPLFYFHIVLSAATDSKRIDSLQRVFGTHNYGVYVLNNDRTSALAIDVLTQHRRIRAKLDLRSVLAEFMSEKWDGVNLNSVLAAAEKLEFRIPYLQVYGEKAVAYPLLRDRFFSFLRCKILKTRLVTSPEIEYDNPFYGVPWVHPIHLGIIAATTPQAADECLGLLRYWQLQSSYMSRIGPHFGLSKDYDEFVAGASASLWALLATLFKNVPGATEFIAEQMMEVFSKLHHARPAVTLFTAVWLLHVSGSGRVGRVFAEAARFVNQYGVPHRVLESPPAWIDLESPDGWCTPNQNDFVAVSDMDDFRNRMCSSALSQDDIPAEDIAITLLIGRPHAGWEAIIVRDLWASV